MTGSSVLLDYTENRQGATALNVNFGRRYYVAVLVKDEQGRTSIYAPAAVDTLHHRLIFATSTEYASTFMATTADVDAACEAAKPSVRTASFKALYVGGGRTACSSAYCNPSTGGDLNDWPLIADTSYESTAGDLVFTTNFLAVVQAGATVRPIGNSRTWTGLNANWTHATNNCQNWTSLVSNVKGAGGWGTNTSTAIWSGYDWGCAGTYKVYCVEQ